jgi:hypothetical protein
MEAAKHTPRGASHQRPKSWDKGTKSGSEKRKMREQGKREAREMNEEAEQFDPVKAFDSHIRATKNLLNPDARGKMPSEFYTTLVDKGVPHEEAVQRTKNMYSLHPPVQFPKTNKTRGDYVYLRDPNTGEAKRIAGHDAYDAQKDGFYESVQHRLRKILSEGKDVGPDDAMAHEIPEPHPDYNPTGAPEDADEIIKAGKKLSHADVIERLNRAHETALSRIATSYGKGGKHAKLDPYYMLGHYMEHIEDLHDPIRGDLT